MYTAFTLCKPQDGHVKISEEDAKKLLLTKVVHAVLVVGQILLFVDLASSSDPNVVAYSIMASKQPAKSTCDGLYSTAVVDHLALECALATGLCPIFFFLGGLIETFGATVAILAKLKHVCFMCGFCVLATIIWVAIALYMLAVKRDPDAMSHTAKIQEG